jgi:hypothetical protein
LSHFDVGLPPEIGSCAEGTTITGTCSNGNFVLGQDGSCDSFYSAKCDNTNLPTSGCLTMTVTFAGENVGVGLGLSILIDKEAQTCSAACGMGPSCEPCDGEEGEECLTRTIGFWGNHPWITNNYDPVTVCGDQLGCDNLASDTGACSALSCTSIMEGLCSVPGQELPTNQSYVTMVRQLTAAKLNLNATAALSDGGTCSTWTLNDRSIQDWIAYCEGLCGADKATISGSGCIEALDAFNNSQDTGFDIVPAPFNRPPVNDQGVIAGADPSQCNLAQGNNKKTKLVIGKLQCQ